jgi:hypothetical protein
MPLPVAHALVGGAVCVAADRDGDKASWQRLGLAVLLANAADLDFLPGLLVGDPHRYHRMAAHSLGWALLVAVVAAWLVRRGLAGVWPLRPGLPQGAVGTALMVGVLWTTHALLDSLNADYTEPIGVMIFWPVSTAWVPSLPFFYNIEKVAGPASLTEFASSLFTLHNARALALEFAVTAPILGLALWWRRRR